LRLAHQINLSVRPTFQPIIWEPQKTTLARGVAKVCFEPDPAMVILCCVRSQREKCGICENRRAATQRENRSFKQAADGSRVEFTVRGDSFEKSSMSGYVF
jgi:hypothetical protein